MNKRIISLIVTLCLICSMVPMSVSAVTVIVSGTCGKNLRWQLDEDGLLTISGTGAMTDFDFYDYEKDAAPWAAYSDQIETVFVSNGVTSIGEDAFWYCENLKSIEFSNSVVSLGNYAVYGCNMLTSVRIGNGLTAIGTAVFDCCDNLRVIEIDPQNPNYCTDESSVIYDAEKITVVRAPTGLSGQYIIPDTVTHIAADAFMHCEKLTEIVMQEGIVSIGSGAFVGCTSLTTVEIPNGVTQIESSAFSGCNFDTITIPNTVTAIRRYAFFLCENITDVFYSGTKSEWSAIEVYRDNAGLTQAPFIHYSTSDAKDHWKSTKVSCGGIVYICERCDCGYMRDENGEQIKDQHVFDREVATVEYIKTPATCTTPAVYYKSCECGAKGEETFAGVDVNPRGHLFIDGECFRCDIIGGNCGENLKWSLDSIGVLTIWGTGALESYFTNNEAPWSGRKDSVVQLVVDMGVTTIGSSAFSGCGNLINASLPDGISRIGNSAFYNCNSLEEISIPSSVTYIGSATFQGCSSLTSITIPNGITEIGGNLFAGCSSLTNIFIPESVTTIKSGAFDGCTNLSSINIPDGVTSIGYYAFHNCVNLTNINLPSNLEEIDKYTFMGCTGLTTIAIPNKVASIGELAFHYCKGLSSIVIPSNVITINKNAFAACTNILDIYYGGTANEWSALGENVPVATYIHYNCNNLDDHWITTLVDATCGENGFSYEHCSCGYKRNDLTIPATGEHVFDQEIVDENYLLSEATCTSPALYYKSCICGAIGSEAFEHGSLKDHDYKIIVQYPSCTEMGYTTHMCICGNIYVTDYVDALGHDMGEWKTVTSPTCTENGSETRICSRCDHTENRSIDATGHSHTAIVTAPTCIEDGFTTYTCSCGDSYVSDYVDALGHDMGEWKTVIAPTCTEDGSESCSCSRCGHTEVRTIDATGHSHTAVVTAPTCIEDGFITYTCSCGDSYVSDYVDALGHDMGEWETVIAPTCTEDGSESRSCFRCEYTETQSIDAVGHSYIGTITAPTCTERGYTTYTCSCGDTYVSDEVPALGHTEETIPAVAATCTNTGLTEGKKCSVCGEILLSQEVVPALGHDWKGTSCQRCDATRENPFNDVADGSFYIDPVLWAVENGITNGATATTFNPNGTCLRAHVVTFLHRAAGNPAPASNKNPFNDVKSSDFFYQPVLWAVEKGITNGTSATTFGSYANCNRAAVVTFLWRAAGSPEPKTTNNPFVDVKTTDFFYKPVLWAVENGITNGVDTNHFGPGTDCNRAQVVTFLYRAYN
ncbi:MAG: leucine-rich repeat protein [Oscillospiraceae bacterium]|nr:leucine-rich repeat protein [Oscillospiraceae bacterium]